jgi:hypothetical protein
LRPVEGNRGNLRSGATTSRGRRDDCLRPESSQEHLPTSIAGVLRLRAIRPSVCDRSAKRFAQDDGFVGGLKYSWLEMQKTRNDRKRHKLSGRQRGGWVFPVGIGLRDPRSQTRDLGHPSVSPFDVAEGTSVGVLPRSRPLGDQARPCRALPGRPGTSRAKARWAQRGKSTTGKGARAGRAHDCAWHRVPASYR